MQVLAVEGGLWHGDSRQQRVRIADARLAAVAFDLVLVDSDDIVERQEVDGHCSFRQFLQCSAVPPVDLGE